MSAEKTLVKTELELLAFDFEDLVNGLGGALGLFLGWSILHILIQCFQILPPVVKSAKSLVKIFDKTY